MKNFLIVVLLAILSTCLVIVLAEIAYMIRVS